MRILILSVLLAASASAQSITLLKLDGQAVTGVGNITSFENVAVNASGQWIIEADTDDPSSSTDGILLNNSGLYIRQGDAITGAPPGAVINSFDAVTLNDAGNSGWNVFFPTNVPTGTSDSGILFNTTLVIQEGSNSTAPQYTMASPFVGFSETKFNNANQILVLGAVDDPTVTSTVDRTAILVAVNGVGALLSETVLTKEGDAAPGAPPETVSEIDQGPNAFALNSVGGWILSVDITGPTTLDSVILLNGVNVAREGSPGPLGRNWDSVLGRTVDLNDSGDWIIVANLSGTTNDDEVIVKNGTTIIAQEGATVPAVPAFSFDTGTPFSGSGYVRIANNGDVFYVGEWNDTDPTKDRGLFRNATLLVQEGVTMVNGMPVTEVDNLQDNFAISRDGRFVIFEGQLAGVDAVFLMDLNPPVAYCFGDGSGTSCPCTPVPLIGDPDKGCPNSFNAGGGKLTASGLASISHDSLVMTATLINNGGAVIFQGTNNNGGGLGAAFGDGLRCAAGTVMRMKSHAVTTNSHQYPDPFFGDNAISIRGAVLVPGDRYYQGWYRSGLAHCNPAENYNLTNGVRITWAP